MDSCQCPKCDDVHINFKQQVEALAKMIEAARKLYNPISVSYDLPGIPKNCHTSKHYRHTYVPWMYQKSYDGKCSVCGHEAAWYSDKPKTERIYLCDCCAEDWSQWNDKRNGLHGSGRDLKDKWAKEFAAFALHQKGATHDQAES